MDQETKRKSVHISMGFLNLLIAIFPRWLLIICVLIALFFILVVARPKVWKGSFNAMASREEDVSSGYLHGPLLYVLMVLISVIFLDLRVASGVFCIMAFGDGFANVIGTRFGKHKFEQYNNKSFEGFLAFVVFAFISSTFAFLLVSINPEINPWISILSIKDPQDIILGYVVLVNLIVSVIAATIELTTSQKLNDNISVPIVSGILLTLLLKL